MAFFLLVPLRAILFTAAYSHLPTILLDDHGLPAPATTIVTTATDWHLNLARTMFSWTFVECALLFVLLMFQAADVLSSYSRVVNFQISLYALLAILLALIPQSIALILLASTTTTRSLRTLLCSLLPGLASLLLLSRIPLSEPQINESFLTRSLSRLVVLGTTILGLLSGFGAVTRAWDFLPSVHSEVIPTEEEIGAAEASLQGVRNDLERRRNHQLATPASPGGNGNWLSRMGDTLRGGDSLSLEIRGLTALEHSMSLNITSMRSKRASALFARTFRGRIWSFIGKLFAGYCIIRVITATYNLFFLRSKPQPGQATTTYPDIITSILVWLFVPSSSASEVPPTLTPESISLLTHHLSLILIGLIVLSSITAVMRGVNRALKITSRKLGTSLILLFLAYLMGIYLLSTLVQLRSSFPPLPPPTTSTANDSNPSSQTPSANITNLFTLIPAYELFNSLFDSVFLLSAILTGAVKWSVARLSMVE